MSGCRAWIRTRARGSKVPGATATLLGTIAHAEGRTRTDTEVTLQQFLRLPRLPIPPLRLERKTRFELATPSLARRCSTAELLPPVIWCRGGDLNSYELTLTTPSRWRVYQFHHLGSNWQEWEDSNPRPAVLETAALPTELHSCIKQFTTISQENKD